MFAHLLVNNRHVLKFVPETSVLTSVRVTAVLK